MKIKFKLLLVFILLGGLMTAATGCNYHGLSGDYEHSFLIRGDVEVPQKISTLMGYRIKRVTKDNRNATAIALADVINAAKPRSTSYDLLFVGADGLSSKIKGDDLTGCNLAYTDQYDWELINELHPISSQVKNLREIIVISTNCDDDKNAVGINDQSGYRSTTAGNLFLSGFKEKRIFEGQSQLNGKEVTVYTTHDIIALDDILSFDKEIAVFGRDGSVTFDKPGDDSFFEITETGIDYTAVDKTQVIDVAGIIADPPKFSITDVASDTIHQLEKGNNVMVIELDGLGWQMLETAKEKGRAPYLGSLPAQQALSVFPPISPAGLAAMITGTTPDINGITGRGIMNFNGEDMFEKAQKLGKRVAYIEGDIKMLNTSVEPVLSVNEGAQDSRVFENTKKAIADNNQLIFTHFHSIDDDATTYGPYALENMEQIELVDRMVQQLVKDFNGMVIITADHGLHPTETAGTHGRVCSEDMLVPYIMIKGGQV